MAAVETIGGIEDISELLGDPRGLLSKGKASKQAPAGTYSSQNAQGDEDPWAKNDPWGGSKDTRRSSGSTEQPNAPPKAPPKAPPIDESSMIDKLALFLLQRPNQLAQRKEVLLASCERGPKLVGDVQLTTSMVEEAFKLARRRVAQSSQPAEAPREDNAEVVADDGKKEERKAWDWDGSAGGWWQHDDRDKSWKEKDPGQDWTSRHDQSWKDETWPEKDAEPASSPPAKDTKAAADVPVSDDLQDEDEHLVERLVMYLKGASNVQKGVAVLRSASSGVPRAAAEAAIAKVFAETQDFQ